MKSILILTTVSGFLEKFERENVRLLKEMGYKIHYAANADTPVYLDTASGFRRQGISFHNISISKSPAAVFKNLRAYRQLKKIIKENDICAIHCHTPVGGLLGRLLGRKFKLKVIYTAHGFHFYKGASKLNNFIYTSAEKWLARFTDAIITINKEDFDAACGFCLKPGGKVYRINGVGLDTKKFTPVSAQERKESRGRLNIKADELFIVSVGELNKNKNHETVVIALGELLKETDLKIKYMICGDGPYRARLEEKIADLNLRDDVFTPGYVNDVRKVLWAADLFIFPSKREGLGMAAVEALASGIPVIAADNRGSREYMADGINGFVCISNTPAEYKELITKFVQLDAGSRERMKAECVRSAAPFGAENTAAVMKDAYGFLLNN